MNTSQTPAHSEQHVINVNMAFWLLSAMIQQVQRPPLASGAIQNRREPLTANKRHSPRLCTTALLAEVDVGLARLRFGFPVGFFLAAQVTTFNRAYSAPALHRNTAIAYSLRPGVDRVGHGIDPRGIPCAQCNGILALEITLSFIISQQAITSTEQRAVTKHNIAEKGFMLLFYFFSTVLGPGSSGSIM